MLSRLYVNNIALIKEADIQFDSHVNILSGETGSGKSVILDSINFVLGSKADKSMIRYGENQAMVKAEFIVENDSQAIAALEDMDIESDGTIVITRKFSSDGKGSIKINGNSVTSAMLKNVTAHLVDVHGQSEHFFLLNEGNQLKVIDNLCGQEGQDIKAELTVYLDEKRKIISSIDAIGGDESQRERKLDLLNYQIGEIEGAKINVGEYDSLKERQNIIANIEKIMDAISGVKDVLDDDGGCSDMLSTAMRKMASICDVGSKYESIYSRLENLSVEIDDLSSTLTDLSDELNFDEQEAEEVDERINLIKSLKKKYGPEEGDILEFLNKAKQEKELLLNSEIALDKLNKQLDACNNSIYNCCLRLTAMRKQIALKLCKNVEEQLKSLNIPNAKFTVDFEEYDKNSAQLNSANGSDKVCFMFSANKGEPLKPLSKVISGGEMSRFMLAIKTQLKGLNGISTYIFDEIDAGISGFTARTVAEKFIDISKNTQIIAVSHLPQVCAASTAQFLIYKQEEDGKTITRVKHLSDEEKIDEIIRLTGSINSQASREHAKELIMQFKK
jgi:DNA repair protein RecN (Recombination protein N)